MGKEMPTISDMVQKDSKAAPASTSGKKTPDNDVQTQIKDTATQLKMKKAREKREALPKERFMNYNHPMAFIQDVEVLQRTYKRQPGRKAISTGEFTELAWYLLREKLTGEAVPDWVLPLEGLTNKQ